MSEKKQEDKKILIVVPNTESNGLIRASIIYQALKESFDIKLLGFGQSVFPTHKDIPLKMVKLDNSILSVLKALRILMKESDSSIIIASKVRLRSLLIALVVKLLKRVPVILDCDDWDLSNYYEVKGTFKRIRNFFSIWRFMDVDYVLYRAMLEKLVIFANRAVVGSRLLANRYNGILVYHTDYKFYKKKLELNNDGELSYSNSEKMLIGFTGTVFPYKGLKEVADVVDKYFPDTVKIRAAGVSNIFLEELLKSYPNVFEYVGPLSPEKIPNFLTHIDVAILFSKDTLHQRGGVPGKLFDAMAVGKAIIATKVGDIPYILGDSGILLNPEDTEGLREALEKLLKDSELRKELGAAARKRYLELFPENYLSTEWQKIIETL